MFDPQPYTVPEQTQSRTPRAPLFKMKALELPSFDGKLGEWRAFWQTFDVNVGQQEYTDQQKVDYLHQLLTGKAREEMECHELIGQNYHIIVEDLKAKFGNTARLTPQYYDLLRSLPIADTAARKREVINKIKKLLTSLVIDQTLEHPLIEEIIVPKFPSITTRVMDILMPRKDATYNLKQLMDAIELVVCRDERIADIFATKSGAAASQGHGNNNNRRQPLAASLIAPTVAKVVVKDGCTLCDKDNHSAKDCLKYVGVSVRKSRLADRKLCALCGAAGHFARSCSLADRKCEQCGSKGHGKVTCIDYMEALKARHASKPKRRQGTFLESFICLIQLDSGAQVPVRGVMDSGSAVSYISRDLVRKWRLQVQEPHLMDVGRFGSSEPFTIETGRVLVTLSDRSKKNSRKFEFMVTPCITGDIETCPSSEVVKSLLPSNMNFADPQIFDIQRDGIEMTIGNDFQFSVFTGENKFLKNGITLRQSMFGWIPSGCTRSSETPVPSLMSVTPTNPGLDAEKTASSDLPPIVHTFDSKAVPLDLLWSLEALGIKESEITSTDDPVLRKFRESRYFEDGRYVVRWPWKQDNPRIPSNYRMCKARLASLVSKTSKETLVRYDAVIKEQLASGIIELVQDCKPSTSKLSRPLCPKHYLPHRAIVQKDKLRVVYDGSAKSHGNPSINSLMHKGLTLTENLVGLLLKFRLSPIALSADIEKAFLQISLNKLDRDVVRFLWLKDINRPCEDSNIEVYRFCRVLFGIIASPFLLNIVLQDHLDMEPTNKWLQMVKDKFYVDNLLISVPDVSTAVCVYKAVTTRLASASFNLRDWTSNDPKFLNAIGAPVGSTDLSEQISVLGLFWDRVKDSLYVRLPSKEPEFVLTKQLLLQFFASIYDPLGLFGPVTLPLKLLIQQCWKDKFEWDECLPRVFLEKWLKIRNGCNGIPEIPIQRRYFMSVPSGPLILHVFSDASIDAFSCCAYLTYEGQENSDDRPALIYSKVRVAPPNLRRKDQSLRKDPSEKDSGTLDPNISLTIPKMELLGLLIGKRASTFLKTHLDVKRAYLWTDSSTVLQWLHSDKVLPQFVQNRVTEVRKAPNLVVGFVPGEENPADVATRGSTAADLAKNQLWWHGPQWLNQQEFWPSLPANTKTFHTPVVSLISGKVKPHDSIILPDKLEKELPSWDAALDHFKELNSKNRDPVLTLSSLDLHNEAETSLLKELQKKYFYREFELLEKGLQPNSDLYLFVMGDGLIRCKGRLQNASFPWDTIHPILLPRRSPLTRLYLFKIHSENHHIGANHLLAKIRERFWVVRARSLVNSVIHQCRTCRTWEGGPYQLPPMVPLPLARVTEASPFLHTGVDYCGPLNIYENENSQLGQKVYVCLFVCLVTRAVHLEVARDLSGEEFLGCLRRFVNIRGPPKVIISDNATNFTFIQPLVGDKVEVLDKDLDLYLNTDKIAWKFIPSYAPWHGGAYERLVSLVKRSLKKTYGFQYLNLFDFVDALSCIQNTLNSRPLTYLSSNDVISPLTPNHYLRLRTVNAVGQLDLSAGPLPSTAENLKRAWQHYNTVIDSFWDVFRSSYLANLRERHVAHHKPVKGSLPFVPNIGDVVLIKEPSAPRSTWQSGVVKHLSNHKTIASVETDNNRILLRSVNLLYPLELPTIESHQPIPKAPRVPDPQPGETSRKRRRRR